MTFPLTPDRERGTTVVTATGHAGEILQGAIRDNRKTRRLLLSLPAPALWTRAEVHATPGFPMSVEPAWAHKTLLAARMLCRRLEVEEPEAVIRLSTNIPVGKGCGSSTTDILAALRALLTYTGSAMTEESTARLIVEVEEASDGSVLSRPALFRHREGVVEEYLPGFFPEMRVVVIDAQPAETIHTVSMPRARYSESQMAMFETLLRKLRRAFREGSAADVGEVATASARISQQFLPKPHLETLVDLVKGERGYGLSVSHSGTVICALLPIQCEPDRCGRIREGARTLGMEVLTEYALNRAAAQGIAA